MFICGTPFVFKSYGDWARTGGPQSPDHSPCQEYQLLQLRGHLHVMGTPGAQTLGLQSGSPVSGAAQLNKDAGKLPEMVPEMVNSLVDPDFITHF